MYLRIIYIIIHIYLYIYLYPSLQRPHFWGSFERPHFLANDPIFWRGGFWCNKIHSAALCAAFFHWIQSSSCEPYRKLWHLGRNLITLCPICLSSDNSDTLDPLEPPKKSENYREKPWKDPKNSWKTCEFCTLNIRSFLLVGRPCLMYHLIPLCSILLGVLVWFHWIALWFVHVLLANDIKWPFKNTISMMRSNLLYFQRPKKL